MISVPIQKMSPDFVLPSYALPGSSGLDLRATASGILESGSWSLVPTGVKIALPEGYEGQVRPRSGLAVKHGITVLNSPGTIDAAYRGEIIVILINFGKDAFKIEKDMRIAQLVIAPVVQISWQEVSSLPDSVRKDGKFGSTGI